MRKRVRCLTCNKMFWSKTRRYWVIKTKDGKLLKSTDDMLEAIKYKRAGYIVQKKTIAIRFQCQQCRNISNMITQWGKRVQKRVREIPEEELKERVRQEIQRLIRKERKAMILEQKKKEKKKNEQAK